MYKKSYLFGIGGILFFSLLIPKLNLEKTSYQKINQASNNYEIVMPAEGQTNTMGAVVYNRETKQEEVYVWGNIWFAPNPSIPEGPGPTHYPLKIDFDILNDYFADGAVVTDMAVERLGIDLVITDGDGQDHIFAWGANASHQVGNGSSEYVYSPLDISENFGNYIVDGGTVNDYDNGEFNQTVYLTDKDGYDHVFSWGIFPYNGVGFAASLPTEITYNLKDQNGNSILEEEGSQVIEGESIEGSTLLGVEDGNGQNYVFGWGYNSHANLGVPEGLNHKVYFYTPTDFSISYQNDFDNGYHIQDLDVGRETGNVLLQNDLNEQQIYLFGTNYYGALGLGEEIQYVANPLNSSYIFEDLFDDNYRIKTSEMGDGSAHIVFKNKVSGQERIFGTGEDYTGQVGNGAQDNEDAGFPYTFYYYEFTELTDQFPELEAGGEIISLESTESTNFAFTKDKDGKTHLYGWGSNAAGELATEEYGEHGGVLFYAPFEIIIK